MNREITEFNGSKRNRKLLAASEGYAFVSCPDFSHEHGVYTYRSLGGGIPLSFALAAEFLRKLDKDVSVFVSDHETHRPEVLRHLNLSFQEMNARIEQSLEKIRADFPGTRPLSSAYSYQAVCERKAGVPADYQMTLAVIGWIGEGKSQGELEDRYREKYAQMQAFLEWCGDARLCPVLLYSKLSMNLVSSIRKSVPVPVIFLEASDPH